MVREPGIRIFNAIMPGLVPGIHVLDSRSARKDVDGRVKTGHDKEH